VITVKQLKGILESLPDEATLVAYEGVEGIGLTVDYHGKEGWIDTGHEETPCDQKYHELQEFSVALEYWSPESGTYVQ